MYNSKYTEYAFTPRMTSNWVEKEQRLLLIPPAFQIVMCSIIFKASKEADEEGVFLQIRVIIMTVTDLTMGWSRFVRVSSIRARQLWKEAESWAFMPWLGFGRFLGWHNTATWRKGAHNQPNHVSEKWKLSPLYNSTDRESQSRFQRKRAPLGTELQFCSRISLVIL